MEDTRNFLNYLLASPILHAGFDAAIVGLLGFMLKRVCELSRHVRDAVLSARRVALRVDVNLERVAVAIEAYNRNQKDIAK